MPPISPPVAAGESVLYGAGEVDGDADMTTTEMGIVGSRLTEDSIAAVDP